MLKQHLAVWDPGLYLEDKQQELTNETISSSKEKMDYKERQIIKPCHKSSLITCLSLLMKENTRQLDFMDWANTMKPATPTASNQYNSKYT